MSHSHLVNQSKAVDQHLLVDGAIIRGYSLTEVVLTHSVILTPRPSIRRLASKNGQPAHLLLYGIFQLLELKQVELRPSQKVLERAQVHVLQERLRSGRRSRSRRGGLG